MFCTVCAAHNTEPGGVCGGCGAALEPVARTRSGETGSRARTVAGAIPIAAVILVLLAVVGRDWRAERALADDYRAAAELAADGRLMEARSIYARLDGFRDAEERGAGLDAVLLPLEERTRRAGLLLDDGRTAEAIVELRAVVAELPESGEAVRLLEEARGIFADEVIIAVDGLVAAGDVAGARAALVDGLALEPTSAAMATRLAELDARHPLLLVTSDGDVAVAELRGDGQRVISTGEAAWAVWSPDRTRVAYLDQTGVETNWDATLWVVDADGAGRRKLADTAFRQGAPIWSPDGHSVVYLATDAFDWTDATGWIGLRRVDLTTGAVEDLTGDRFDFVTSVTWSPDGRQLAFIERHILRLPNTRDLDVRSGDLHLLDIGTGATVNLSRGRIEEARWASWSPAGDRMLVLTSQDDLTVAEANRLYALDMASGALEEIETHGIVTSYPYWSPDGSAFAATQDNRVVRIWAEDGEEWVRLPNNVETVLSWAPDGSAILAPPRTVGDAASVIWVGEGLGRIDTVQVVFDTSFSGGGAPQWSPRTRPLPGGPLPAGTALD